MVVMCGLDEIVLEKGEGPWIFPQIFDSSGWCRSSKQKHAPRPSNNLLKGCKLVLSCTHDVCKKSLFL